jgi:hypothetical protein
VNRYNGGKSESGCLKLTSLLNIGRQFILTAFDIHYYLSRNVVYRRSGNVFLHAPEEYAVR